jgi:hypothetical protein
MEGPPRSWFTSLRLTRHAESSRLRLELVRRAFELIVPHTQGCCQTSAATQPRSTTVARGTRAKGA